MLDQIGYSSLRMQMKASHFAARSTIAFMLTPFPTLDSGSPCIHMTFGRRSCNAAMPSWLWMASMSMCSSRP